MVGSSTAVEKFIVQAKVVTTALRGKENVCSTHTLSLYYYFLYDLQHYYDMMTRLINYM